MINYGGRVTDDWDRRCLMSTLRIFCNSKILDDSFLYNTKVPQYICPVFEKKHEDWIDMINNYDLSDPPEIFGMNSNANIVFQLQESENIVSICRYINPKDTGGDGGLSPDDIVTQVATSFEEKMMPVIRKDDAGPNLSLTIGDNYDSMTIFLFQEIERFSKLISVMTKSLSEIKKAIKGLVLMSPDLNKLHTSFLKNEVPELWVK